MDESDPVEDGEFVYRRIHRTFFNPASPIQVRAAAFRPNENDSDGISVFRTRFLEAADTLRDIDPVKTKDYHVAQLTIRDLRNLGLIVVPAPIPSGPNGHAMIPQLSWSVYQADKQRWKPVLVELAKLASNAIVLKAGG